jgi:hypothetical protein
MAEDDDILDQIGSSDRAESVQNVTYIGFGDKCATSEEHAAQEAYLQTDEAKLAAIIPFLDEDGSLLPLGPFDIVRLGAIGVTSDEWMQLHSRQQAVG